ncbi:Probable polysaccharide deacetylase pdaA precursor [Aerococcus viridans]|uniref:Polysaccharide deacetylase n=2 Tax=Aerococcus viridans TaxID=1377 RepID=A0AAU8U679_9LACT|nr:polysaccharide deacetylase family protein [Aerococcus viridans]AMC01632.1 polysaccharide deacetylase [Aerococcus viridans]EFG49821.1 polysaccharide deacetylase [Aerococcus viridans ATCC 11563 = CCUG 4311]SUU13734.1 Probable polysaccharide deacetylase pdaA precursor [Aerococcus viridans]
MLKRLPILLLTGLLLTGCAGNEQENGDGPQEQATSSESSEATDTNSVEGAKSTDLDVGTNEERDNQVANYYIDPETSSVLPANEDANPDVVLATVDDVPRKLPETPTSSVKEAHAMADRGIYGIFFVNGMYLQGEDGEEGQQALKEIADMGHVIGNHTLTHYSLDQVPDEETLRHEIIGNQDIIEEIIGYRPQFFRPPHGIEIPELEGILEEENMVSMNWSYGFDWDEAYSDPATLADVMVNTEFLSPGANLLMHDLTWTKEAMPAILDGIQAKGYEFVDARDIATRDEMADL